MCDLWVHQAVLKRTLPIKWRRELLSISLRHLAAHLHWLVMQISDGERDAVKRVIEAGESYGFGNMIAHLNTAWAKSLMEKWGMSEESARALTHGSGYPFQMQQDLIERNYWDESGKSYSA